MLASRFRLPFSRRKFSSYAEKRLAKASELAEFAEMRQASIFSAQLQQGSCPMLYPPSAPLLDVATKSEVLASLQAGMATFALHVEARCASACGEGFYTIGPCGEELLSAVGLVLREDDAVALHYRHLATQIARHARPVVSSAKGDVLAATDALKPLLLDRARGYCVSAQDPVTQGAHCALGGGTHDFMVSSTLASQATPAVGRAMAPGITRSLGLPAEHCLLPSKSLSYISLGDGSVNNSHFLSAVNFATYADHRSYRCPVLFGISDNGLCISLKGYDWLDRFLKTVDIPVFKCDGRNLSSVFKVTKEASDFVRRRGKPGILVFEGMPRRFGHAATDRQSAYLSQELIEENEYTNPLSFACAQAVYEEIISYEELNKMWELTSQLVYESFVEASKEVKLEQNGVQHLIQRNSSSFFPSSSQLLTRSSSIPTVQQVKGNEEKPVVKGRKNVMRKHMNQAIAETLTEQKNFVYLGEDVEHGGYYLVTEGLSKKFPGSILHRIRDMPPDETTLLGVAHGLSQCNLQVCVEIPYSKYLDCGFDMFAEIAATHWITGGRKPSSAGLIIRLQGFDRGVFGGNFHTHNALNLLPGLDVVLFSNGADWVKGWRNAVKAAQAGRVVMIVDSTDLLNKRHIGVKDSGMLTPYPIIGDDEEGNNDDIHFDTIIRHPHGIMEEGKEDMDDVTIVTYGTGVIAARNSQSTLIDEGHKVGIIEVPCVSAMSPKLSKALANSKSICFADPCKKTQAPLLHFIASLQDQEVIGMHPSSQQYVGWNLVAAAPTYNPLGSTITFLNDEDISNSARRLLSSIQK